MKKYIFIILLAIGAFSVASCEKFLDVQAQGAPTQNQYFQNDQQAIDAIDGVYARLAQESCMGRELYWEQAVANDIVWGRGRSFSLKFFDFHIICCQKCCFYTNFVKFVFYFSMLKFFTCLIFAGATVASRVAAAWAVAVAGRGMLIEV